MPPGAYTSGLQAPTQGPRPQGATPGTQGSGEPRLGQECGWLAWLSSALESSRFYA